MRTLLPVLIALLVLFPSCKPKQADVKSVAPTITVTESGPERGGAEQSTDLEGNLDEFQIAPTGSSASSGSSKS